MNGCRIGLRQRRKDVMIRTGGTAAITVLSLFLSACGDTVTCRDVGELVSCTYVNGNQITGIGDPYLFTYEGKYYCTATEKGEFFCLYRSEDLREWEKAATIFPDRTEEGWAEGSLWQPQIVVGEDGRFYLYYSGANGENSLRIGVAAADTLTGPYRDVHGAPLFDFGYACIDPKFYTDDDGSMYLYYSRDCSENIVGGRHISQIYVAEMEDYTHLREGREAVLCLTPEQQWELPEGMEYFWNEGPDMLKHDGIYYLFYSGGFYEDRTYSIGYATAESPLGPFAKYACNPVLSSTEYASGPGNNSFFYSLDGKELFNAYHTHTDMEKGGGDRKLTIDRCGFREDGTFYMNGPTITMQPLPSGSGLRKLEGAFTVTASSTASGTTDAVLDGEFSAGIQGKAREWSAEEGEAAWIKVDFGEKRKVDCLFLYRAYEDSNTPQEVNIRFSDGSKIGKVQFPEDSGEAVVLYFDPVYAESVTVEVGELGSAQRFGLAEIGIYARE